MKRNMGSTDRIVRIVFAVLVGLLVLFNVINGTLAVVLGILAGIFFITAILGFCPLYVLFGISTKKG